MMAALELPAMAERLMPPKRSVMNSRFPKPMVSPREKISHDRHSPSAAMVEATEHLEEKHAAIPPS
jgi:hypothetical protein